MGLLDVFKNLSFTGPDFEFWIVDEMADEIHRNECSLWALLGHEKPIIIANKQPLSIPEGTKLARVNDDVGVELDHRVVPMKKYKILNEDEVDKFEKTRSAPHWMTKMTIPRRPPMPLSEVNDLVRTRNIFEAIKENLGKEKKKAEKDAPFYL